MILAGGGYTDNLVPRLRRSILPIATYVLLTEAAPERIAEAVRTPMAISDNRRAATIIDSSTKEGGFSGAAGSRRGRRSRVALRR